MQVSLWLWAQVTSSFVLLWVMSLSWWWWFRFSDCPSSLPQWLPYSLSVGLSFFLSPAQTKRLLRVNELRPWHPSVKLWKATFNCSIINRNILSSSYFLSCQGWWPLTLDFRLSLSFSLGFLLSQVLLHNIHNCRSVSRLSFPSLSPEIICFFFPSRQISCIFLQEDQVYCFMSCFGKRSQCIFSLFFASYFFLLSFCSLKPETTVIIVIIFSLKVMVILLLFLCLLQEVSPFLRIRNFFSSTSSKSFSAFEVILTHVIWIASVIEIFFDSLILVEDAQQPHSCLFLHFILLSILFENLYLRSSTFFVVKKKWDRIRWRLNKVP